MMEWTMDRAKRWLLHYGAPEGTRRRHLLRSSKSCLQRILGHRFSVLPTIVVRAPRFDIYDASSFTSFLDYCRTPPLQWSVDRAARSDLEAARLAMGLLQVRPELRKHFPRALSAGANGAYCRWLCSRGSAELELPAQATDNIRAAFSRGLSARPVQLFDHDFELAALLPLALTPWQRHQFACWLLTVAKAQNGFLDEEICWHLFESAEDPSQGLLATYLRMPDWQKRFPNALTTQGEREFLTWVKKRFGNENVNFADVRLAGVAHPEGKSRWLCGSAPAKVSTGGDIFELPGVNVLGHFCHPAGLGEAAHALVGGLKQAGVRTSCRDIPVSFQNDQPEHANYLGLEHFDHTIVLMAPEPDLKRGYRTSRLAPRQGVYRIAVWYWELENVPLGLRRHEKALQEIWAPTRFIERAMGNAFKLPVTHMLPGVELGMVPNLSREHFGLPEDRFLFLFMFDMCSVMERKNPLAVIVAYQQAFRRDDRVALAIKVSRGDWDKKSLERLRQATKAAGAILIDGLMPRQEAHGLMQCCDCYTSLHRSEGFGLTMAEAMLMAKPVIATNYSGNVDFMSGMNSFLVDYEKVPITQELPYYGMGNLWANPSVSHAAECMRWIYEHQEEARALGERAQSHTSNLLSFRAAGERMASRLRQLQMKMRFSDRRAGAA